MSAPGDLEGVRSAVDDAQGLAATGMSQGLALLAHGARDAAWRAPFDAVVAHVAQREPRRPVRLAFLEFMAPDLEAACEELVALGCTRVDIVPLFLGTGGHVRRDVPETIGRLRERLPHVQWRLHEAVGESAAVIGAMGEAALAAVHEGSA